MGVYYAAFSILFLLSALILSVFSTPGIGIRRWPGVLCPVLTALTALVLAIPVNSYRLEMGPNPEGLIRLAGESEIYGLKIVQLLLPIKEHYVELFARAAALHDDNFPLTNENRTAALGVLGSLGFLVLIFHAVFAGARRYMKSGPAGQEPSPNGAARHQMNSLASLTLVAILYATVRGFTALTAILIGGYLRAGNRVSVFIAFMSFCAVGILVTQICRRYFAQPGPRRAAFVATVALVGVLAFMDLTGKLFDSRAFASSPSHAYSSMREFIGAVEAKLSPGEMVLQLPYVPFPESRCCGRMRSYDHLWAYLHARKGIHWSYPSMRGRPASKWQKAARRGTRVARARGGVFRYLRRSGGIRGQGRGHREIPAANPGSRAA